MSVTNDVQVLKKLSFKASLTSAEVAGLLGLTPFQVTARLKSMEKRALVKRDQAGKWLKLRKWHEVQAEQEQAHQQKALRKAAWVAGLPPQAVTDEGVPHIDNTRGWRARYTPYADDRWVLVFMDPSTGTEYIRAHFAEKADLIRDFKDLPPARLVKFHKGNRFFRMVEEYHQMLEDMLKEEAS